MRSRTGSHAVRRGTRSRRNARLGTRKLLGPRHLTRSHRRAPLGTRRLLTGRHLTRRHRRRPRDLGLRGLPGGLPRLFVLVRPGRSRRRQREHRAWHGLLRRRPLVRGGQRTPPPSGRLRLLVRPRALGGHVHGDRAGRAVSLAPRGQRRRGRR
ncbi:hypothetical protein, partial [Streptomyces tunisiensis]|uniref:hypothetical protein n=1 Tax=Streptomyces tunisiensis TaxID=948699 RepID=UPI003EE3AB47